MKVKKRTLMLISFCLGAMLLATTAFADIVSKSGYDQLKDSLKTTAQKSSEELDSFTLEVTMEMKSNGQTLISSNELAKYQRSNNARESFSTQESVASNDYRSYSYTDDKVIIRSEDKETYYVTEFNSPRSLDLFTNPFAEEGAEDIEKIADALVGSLKDHVIVLENPDGSKELSGSLSEMQIPALVNALASFQLKQEFSGRQVNMPHLTEDIFVKEISGKSKVNPDGMMESLFGTAVLSGKDKNGEVHEISFEVLLKMSDINNTVVTKPDLTGKEVVKEADRLYNGRGIANPEKFQGLFKNDILIEENGMYVKIGERFVDIANIDNESVSGRYFEEYREGYEQYTQDARDFRFNASFDKDGRQAMFDYPDEQGNDVNGSIYFEEYIGKVYFHIHQSANGVLYDTMFNKVFE